MLSAVSLTAYSRIKRKIMVRTPPFYKMKRVLGVFVFLCFIYFLLPSDVSPPKHATRWKRPSQFLDNVTDYKIPEYRREIVLRKRKGEIAVVQGLNGRMRVVEEDESFGKIILLKNNPDWDWMPMAEEGLASCPSKCTITNNESFKPADVAAVIFYATNYPRHLLPTKQEGQVWIYFTLESPYFSQDFEFRNIEWRNKFNWTMTYRRDSDVWYPYGRIDERKTVNETDYAPVVRKKTKQIAWFVSHCETPSQREHYVSELRNYISVDVYGACGQLKCLPEGGAECFRMLSDHYKFYLSFESVFCRDYVTEKVFEFILKADIVPVVRGLADYSKYLPPKSYINAADFSSVKKLGEYLLYLDSNDAAYGEYLQWKNYYYAQEKPIPICEICIKLSNPNKYRNVYDDVFLWWHRNVCSTPPLLKQNN